MINKVIGILIVFLYFANYQICNLAHYNDVAKFWDLKVGIYCVIIILCIKYKPYIKGKLGLFESVFTSIVINNIIVSYFFNENSYSYSDLIVIPTIITIEYAKYYKDNFREYISNMRGGRSVDSSND